MKLKKISWKNFKSYSNAMTELVFNNDPSLNLIVGTNGTGKSSIADCIIYALYGKIDGTNNGVFELLSDLLYEGGDFLEEMSEEDTAFGKYIHNKYMEDAREVWEEEKLLYSDEG